MHYTRLRLIKEWLKLQTTDTKAWILQITIITVLLAAYWVPELLKNIK